MSADATANVAVLMPPRLRLTDVVEVPLDGVGEPTPMADSALDAVTLCCARCRRGRSRPRSALTSGVIFLASIEPKEPAPGRLGLQGQNRPGTKELNV